jgi:cytochrome c biogenesis protein CcmG/thiol:disulfide interchange protein DsbE
MLRDPVEIPPFSVTDFDGRTLQSTDWRGKVVIVNFWATWCPPCLAEIPDLIALQAKYPDQLVVVGISEDQAPIDVVKRFAADRAINYPLAMSTPELHERFTGIIALPTTFVLDPDGRMVKKHVGLLRGVEAEVMTRALSGMTVDAIVERVEDPGKLSLTSAAQITSVPGIDLELVPASRRIELLQALNSEKCTCGCDLSVAKCRIDDPTCEISLPVAQKIVATFNTGR